MLGSSILAKFPPETHPRNRPLVFFFYLRREARSIPRNKPPKHAGIAPDTNFPGQESHFQTHYDTPILCWFFFGDFCSFRLMEFLDGATRLRGGAKALDVWRIETKVFCLKMIKH